jgi:hypothetical protein
MIIPACGFDSVPSELAVFLANKTLKTLAGPDTEIDTSISAFKVAGALSGGTFASFLTAVEQVPRYKIHLAHQDWALSTHIRGARRLAKQLVYTLPFSNPPVYGGLWFMGSVNKSVVQRTWGLTERVVRLTFFGLRYSHLIVFYSPGRVLPLTQNCARMGHSSNTTSSWSREASSPPCYLVWV